MEIRLLVCYYVIKLDCVVKLDNFVSEFATICFKWNRKQFYSMGWSCNRNYALVL